MAIGWSLGFDGGITSDVGRMLRLLLLGSMLLIIGLAFRNGWVEVHWDRFFRDINMPFMAKPEPIREFKFDGQ